MADLGEETQTSNPLPVPDREETASTNNQGKLECLWDQIITIQTHGLDYWVGQMSPKSKLMGRYAQL